MGPRVRCVATLMCGACVSAPSMDSAALYGNGYNLAQVKQVGNKKLFNSSFFFFFFVFISGE